MENVLSKEIDRLKMQLEKTETQLLLAQGKIIRLRGLIEELFLESLPVQFKEKFLKAMR